MADKATGRRGRKADAPADRTGFAEPTVDVEARAGLLMRHNREHGGNAEVATGTAMAAALAGLGVRASPADVSNWERGTVAAPAAVLEGYEVLTGAAPGSIRGIVETMRRCYGAVRVRPRRGERQELGLDEVTRRCQVIVDGAPRGIDWLHYADLLDDERVVLPRFLVEEPFTRLVSEMCRSVGVAYLTRYEALASVLDGPYAEQARDAVRAAILDEHAQVVMDPIVVLSESPDPDVLRWVAGLLRHPEPTVVRGATLAVDNALATGRVDDTTAEVLCAAVVAAYPGPDRQTRAAMESTIKALPGRFLARLLKDLDPGLRAQISHAERPRTDEQRAPLLALAERLQRSVSEAIGGDPAQPLLARLVYEAVFEERATRRFHALSVLKAVPYQARIAEANAELARTHPDPAVRATATDAALHFGHARSADAVRDLLASDDEDTCRAGLVASAHQAIPLGDEILRSMMDVGNPLWRTALYAAGMNGEPIVARLADDPAADPRLRGAARWWRREGRAVTS